MSQFEMDLRQMAQEDQDIFNIFRERDEREGRIPVVIEAQQIAEVMGEAYDPEEKRPFDFSKVPQIAFFAMAIGCAVAYEVGVISATAAFIIGGVACMAFTAFNEAPRWF